MYISCIMRSDNMDDKVEINWDIVLDNLCKKDLELIKKKINKIIIEKYD